MVRLNSKIFQKFHFYALNVIFDAKSQKMINITEFPDINELILYMIFQISKQNSHYRNDLL